MFSDRNRPTGQDRCVKFSDVVQDIQKRWRESSIARRTERGLQAYHNSGRVLYPRLFGYRRTADGIVVVDSEARIVRSILEMLARGKSVEEVKRRLDDLNIRGRSGNLLTHREIAAMVKPVYCGRIEIGSGWVRSEHYPPIVGVELVKKARKALSEGLDFDLLGFDEGVFLTISGGRQCGISPRGLFRASGSQKRAGSTGLDALFTAS